MQWTRWGSNVKRSQSSAAMLSPEHKTHKSPELFLLIQLGVPAPPLSSTTVPTWKCPDYFPSFKRKCYSLGLNAFATLHIPWQQLPHFIFHVSTTSLAKCLLLTLNKYYRPICLVRRLKPPAAPRQPTHHPSLSVLMRWRGSARNTSCDCQTISAQTRYFSLVYCGLVKPSLQSEEHSLQSS